MTSITLVSPAKRAQGDDVRCRGQAAIQEGARDGSFDVDLAAKAPCPVSTAATAIYKTRTDRQGSNDANGQIALRILGLLRGGRDRVESDVGEEYVRRARADARETREARTNSNPCPSWRDSCSENPGAMTNSTTDTLTTTIAEY